VEDWRAGALSSERFLHKLRESCTTLRQYEANATPPGWSCHWHRYSSFHFDGELCTSTGGWQFPAQPHPHLTLSTTDSVPVAEEKMPRFQNGIRKCGRMRSKSVLCWCWTVGELSCTRQWRWRFHLTNRNEVWHFGDEEDWFLCLLILWDVCQTDTCVILSPIHRYTIPVLILLSRKSRRPWHGNDGPQLGVPFNYSCRQAFKVFVYRSVEVSVACEYEQGAYRSR